MKNGKETADTSDMTTFKDLISWLEKLDLDKKLEQVSKILEDVKLSDTEAQSSDPEHLWMKCELKVPEKRTVQLNEANIPGVVDYIRNIGYDAKATHNGILIRGKGITCKAIIGEWIVICKNTIQSVWTNADFRENFTVLDFNW